jgi:prepilin-type N-terminal cleavage/methylation domain-containing protein
MLSFNNRAFSFIELLITLGVIAIAFLPLMRMFSVGLEQSSVSSEHTTARYLLQEGMEKLKNLNFTEAQIEALGDIWYPPLDQPALNINKRYWRILREVKKNTDPLEIWIKVYQVFGSNSTKPAGDPIMQAVTLREDLDWEPVQ